MRKPLKTSEIETNSFIYGVEGGDKKSRGRPKKDKTASKSTLSQTNDDLNKRDDLVDCASNIRDDNGRRISINFSEAARIGYESAIYLYEKEPEAFEAFVKKIKDLR
ncbi:hypothetical protein [Aliivibrio wodanis]|uniref:hypothetical protein n=1 Tax=Aliivibrio wodanis TaxID=80852 RepID=UPI00406BF2FF